MKEPKLSNLKIDIKGTQAMRRLMAKNPKIKITINLDAEILAQIRKRAANGGTPYQSYLNWLLKESLAQKSVNEDRVERLEKEVVLIKKKLAA